jgi:HAD superfamily hydrolase (TIGR01509 family)
VRAAREEAFAAVHREYASRRSFLHQDLFRDRVARTAALLGVEATDDVLDRFAEENTAAILEFLLPKPDAAATLRALRERGLYCAVVSTADDAWLGPSLQRHGLDALVDDWTSSEEADSCKPDTAIFAYALGKAGLTAGEVLFVGDSREHDVAGAHAAGLRSVLVAAEAGMATPLAEGLDRSATPDYEIEQLIEVVGIVDALAGS